MTRRAATSSIATRRGTRARPLTASLTLLATLVLARPVAAEPPYGSQEEPSTGKAQLVSPWDRNWLMEANLGFGTPVGLVGVQLERRLGPVGALRAGLGWNGRGPHGAAMLRVRIPEAPALNLGAGFSGGRFTPLCVFCEEPPPSWTLAFFNNYELSLETRAKRGLTFRVFGGYGWLINTKAHDCVVDCEAHSMPVGVPYFGFALGGAFH